MFCLFSSLSLGLRTTDDALEAEIKILKSIQAVPTPSADPGDDGSKIPGGPAPSSALPALSSPLILTADCLASSIDIGPKAPGPGVSALHPLKALLFLKLLCVHPCLVTSQTLHKPYYNHLLVVLPAHHPCSPSVTSALPL